MKHSNRQNQSIESIVKIVLYRQLISLSLNGILIYYDIDNKQSI